VLIFLFFYFGYTSKSLVGCPGCVRSKLVQHTLASIPLANVMCFLVTPVCLFHLVSSLTDQEGGIPAEYRSLAILNTMAPKPVRPAVAPGNPAIRAVLVLGVLLVAVVLGLLSLPRLFQ
jgi:hypothetical protein